MSSSASFDWFWQPPALGDPGIMMIVDTHPGPYEPGVPFVQEDINNVLLHCESKIPPDVHLYQLKIYVLDIFQMWNEIEFTLVNSARRFKRKVPDFSQASLHEVWDNHEARAGRAN